MMQMSLGNGLMGYYNLLVCGVKRAVALSLLQSICKVYIQLNLWSSTLTTPQWKGLTADILMK